MLWNYKHYVIQLTEPALLYIQHYWYQMDVDIQWYIHHISLITHVCPPYLDLGPIPNLAKTRIFVFCYHIIYYKLTKISPLIFITALWKKSILTLLFDTILLLWKYYIFWKQPLNSIHLLGLCLNKFMYYLLRVDQNEFLWNTCMIYKDIWD